jgi:hypothetical protein
MKRNVFLTRFFSAAVICAAMAALAQSTLRFDSQSGSKIKIEGTSTIHDWTVESGIIQGHIEVPPELADPTKPVAVGTKLKPTLEVTVPVRSLKSGKKPMDAIMYEAMNMTAHPKIEYRLQELTVKAVPAKTGDPYQLDAKGTLQVSGVTKTNQMVVSMYATEKTKLRFTGTTSLKMTDFGIKPPAPSVGLGLIKTADDVKLTFEWLTAQKAAPAAAAPTAK